tara:strand:- start:2250 stop:2510 length:261 start_codon:yes stop_codon:yes gene_type:complete
MSKPASSTPTTSDTATTVTLTSAATATISSSTSGTVDVVVNPIQEFLDSLTDKQRKVFEIAKEHMESSYDIKRSNGYLTWLKNKEK